MALVPYRPLGRGGLTGSLTPGTISEPGDFRSFLPRFSETNIQVNLAQTQHLLDLAASKSVTPALDICLSAQEMQMLDQAFSPGVIQGERYTPEGMAGLNR